MIDLTEMAEHRSLWPGWATDAGRIGLEGTAHPNLAFKGSLMVWDKDHLAFWERAKGETLTHLKRTRRSRCLPQPRSRQDVALRGTAELLRDGEVRDRSWSARSRPSSTAIPSARASPC